MKNLYSSLSIAIQDLQKEGYTEDFNLNKRVRRNSIRGAELEVVKFYRFEGSCNTEGNTIWCVIETKSGDKGLLVDAHVYASNVHKDLIEKLRIVR